MISYHPHRGMSDLIPYHLPLSLALLQHTDLLIDPRTCENCCFRAEGVYIQWLWKTSLRRWHLSQDSSLLHFSQHAISCIFDFFGVSFFFFGLSSMRVGVNVYFAGFCNPAFQNSPWYILALSEYLTSQCAECHRLGGVNKRYLLSHRFEGQKFEIKMSSGLIYSEVSLLGLLVAAFFLCSHMVSLCVCLRPDHLFFFFKKKQTNF